MHDDSSPPDGAGDSGNANALPKGTRIFEFEIEHVLGEGGFAIVYLAFDHSLHRHVALKEYLPAELAFRQDESGIVLRSVQYHRTFDAGRKSFVEEARFLAQFEHPSLVKVHRVFESNGTAYMVQGYYPGESLSAVLKGGRRYASEADLRTVVVPLLAAVELLHSRQCLHRDIAPDNIIIQPSGVPVLLDFGAARRIIGDMTQALTAVLKPSFAPIEQYTEDGGLAQGPWTDVYALAATLRMAITGKPPPSSVGRTIKDGIVQLADDPPPNFSLAFLRGIDGGLALLPAERPQTIAGFRAAMGLEADEDATSPPAPATARSVERPAISVPVTDVASEPSTYAAVPSPPIREERRAAPAERVAATPAKRWSRNDVMLAVIAAAAVVLMLLVPFAADWLWPSPGAMPQPKVSRDERSAAPSTAPASPPAAVIVPAAAPAQSAPAAVPVPPPASDVTAPKALAAIPPKDIALPAPPPKTSPSAATPAKVAEPRAPDAITPPRQDPPPKVSAPAPSLIPPPAASPSAGVPATPPREDQPPKLAAAPAQQTAAPALPDVAKARRALVRLAGDPPAYPREAVRLGIESGRVVALVTIDAQGNVADIDIVRSEPPRVFDRAARTALAAWRFRPEGERYQGEVDLRFNLKE